MKKPVYMDCHATTPVDPRVAEAMWPYFTEKFGNAASRSHSFGWDADSAVDEARLKIASAIGASPREIVFTSGATESNNLALKGVAAGMSGKGNHIITCAIEHRAVLDPLSHLEQGGFEVTRLPVSSGGHVDPEALRASITPKTILISIMTANNEIGTIQPVAELGRIAHEHGILFHTDAAQALGRVPLNVEADEVDLLSLSAHKAYGPKGVGALYVRRRSPKICLVPQIHGGGHEHGLRSGTLPVPLIVGFGEAARLAVEEREPENRRIAGLRDRLMTAILESLDDVTVNGDLNSRLANNLNLSFGHAESEAILVNMGDVALSSGSACSSATETSSHVLGALGIPGDRARTAIRFGLGRFSTAEEVEYVAGRIIETVKTLRARSPHHRMTTARQEPKTTVELH